EAFERLPSLSFRRWKWIAFTSPSGRKRGIKKHDRPPGACASTRNASDIGADMNHLWPAIKYSFGAAVDNGSARVVFERTSVPPCFSVIPMPIVTELFSRAGLKLES